MSARLLAPAAALCLLALSGCGGGGGGSASVTPMTEPEPTPGAAAAQLIAQSAAVGGKAGDAAVNAPRPGSVTQSSNGVNGVTVDHVEVSVNFDAGGSPEVSVSNTPDGQTAPAWTANSADAAEGNRELFDDGAAIFAIPNEDGARVVALRTTRANQADTDYLVYGLWAWIPRDVNDVEDFEIGVFADGGDPFTGANVLALTGMATYRGLANGIYSYPDDEAEGGIENDVFEADAELTANFGAADAEGTISGRITNPRSDDSPVVQPGEEPIVLTLGDAPIGTTDGGFFTGAASMTLGGIPHTGQWGGEFFGNGAAGAAPGSVAGTFGVTATVSGIGRATLVGAFGASR